jgi:flagellar motor switch protein FliG
MAMMGIQKATLLLTMLDSSTATELLKGQPHDVIQKIALELSHLDARRDKDGEQAVQVAREFCTDLQRSRGGTLHVKSFVNTLLQNTMGTKEKAAEIQLRLKQAMFEKDPFLALTSASPVHLAAALEDEPPQAIAVVLTALPSKLSTDILARLEEEKCRQTIWRMTQPGDVSPKTMRRIGEVVCKRLLAMTSDDGTPVNDAASKDNLRRVAIVLSGLDKDKRDTLLSAIQGRDSDTATLVRSLMVTWDDIIKIEDKSLQQTLRNVEPTVLAKALHGADTSVREKVLSNISERMKEMIEEEASLMGEPRKKDVITAREEVAKPLREANEAGELLFIEEEEE